MTQKLYPVVFVFHSCDMQLDNNCSHCVHFKWAVCTLVRSRVSVRRLYKMRWRTVWGCTGNWGVSFIPRSVLFLQLLCYRGISVPVTVQLKAFCSPPPPFLLLKVMPVCFSCRLCIGYVWWTFFFRVRGVLSLRPSLLSQKISTCFFFLVNWAHKCNWWDVLCRPYPAISVDEPAIFSSLVQCFILCAKAAMSVSSFAPLILSSAAAKSTARCVVLLSFTITFTRYCTSFGFLRVKPVLLYPEARSRICPLNRLV